MKLLGRSGKMKKNHTKIPGVFSVEPFHQSDNRGEFFKVLSSKTLLGRDFQVAEAYFSVSEANVFRGMHFQAPPHDHNKFVTCVSGNIIDFVTDLRPESTTYLKTIKCDLSRNGDIAIFVPKGCAHGFLSNDASTVMYLVDSEYNAKNDVGFNYASIGENLFLERPLTLSSRDLELPSLEDLQQYF